MRQETISLIAVIVIFSGIIAIIGIPLYLLNPGKSFDQYTFFFVLLIGFLFIVFLGVLLAIKQKRNIWG